MLGPRMMRAADAGPPAPAALGRRLMGHGMGVFTALQPSDGGKRGW